MGYGIFFTCLILFAIFMWRKEYFFEQKIINSALNGNSYAVLILKNKISLTKTSAKIIEEALKGNKYALKILNIEEK